MNHIQVSFPDSTVEMIEELRGALERTEGYRLTRSQILRMALATLRKRLSDEGMLTRSKPARRVKRQRSEAAQ